MTDNAHIALGWLCPRCGHIWSPLVLTCDCSAEDLPGQTVPIAAQNALQWVKTETAMLDYPGVQVETR